MPLWDLAVLVAIVSAAAGLRFWDIGRTSFFYDEAASFFQANRPFFAMLQATAQDNYPPLHNIILWFTIKLAGTGETVLRMPSVIMGVAAVYAIYKTGKLVGPRHVGLASAALLAVLPLHVWHSVEARMYSLLTFASICFLWATLVHRRRPSIRSAAVLTLATVAVLMSHVYGGFLAASVDAYVLFYAWLTSTLRERSTLLWLASQAAAVVLFIPWILVLVNRAAVLQSAGFWIPYPSRWFVAQHMLSLFGRLPVLALTAVSAYYVLRTLARLSRQGRKAFPDFETGLLLSAFVGPIAIGYLVSVIAFPIFYDRYLLVSAPAALLLLSRSVLQLPFPALLRFAMLAALVLSLTPEAIYKATAYQGERHDLRSAAAFLKNHRNEDEPFVAVPGYLGHGIQYYGALKRVLSMTPDQVLRPVTSANRVWLMFSWEGQQLKAQVLDNYERAGFSQKVHAEFHDVTLVRLDRESARRS